MQKFLFYILILVMVSCKSKNNNGFATKDLLNTEKGDSVTILYSSNGKLRAKIMSKTFVHEQDNKTGEYTEMKDGLTVYFFDALDSISSTLKAKKGRYFADTKNILVRDSVVVINPKGEVLTTEELIWDDAKQQFFTEKKVTIKTPTQEIIGQGMYANQDFSKFSIIKPTGIIAIKKGSLPIQ